jgi:hypothetical protein
MRPTNEANLINNIVYSANPSNIVSVMVGGRFLRAGMHLKAGSGVGSVFDRACACRYRRAFTRGQISHIIPYAWN